jgi:hypothetical protein
MCAVVGLGEGSQVSACTQALLVVRVGAIDDD